ncbi:MAG TPA: wax ester/triacylglycerol synthase family O-acyltransferase [Acidimicrobiales bacterium]|jgi:WS/DGAT/MGAT family acyltransferase|nr:wax ester/triacylglycerol synthase family O-acyltransferase [Acidimicrobiales bacterium]
MHRLHGIEAGFVYLETATQKPMDAILVTLAPDDTGSRGGRPISLPELRDHVEARIHLLPSFRWKIRPVPFRLHHPVFVDDPAFNLDYHLRAVTLDPPGHPDQLNRLVAEHSVRTLDRRHPRWELTLVSGLAGGGQALIFNVHHAYNDGVAVNTTFNRLFNDDVESPAPEAPWRPETVTGWQLVKDALVDQARTWRGLPQLVRDTWRGMQAVKARRGSSPILVPSSPAEKPATVLNDSFTLDRIFARTSLELSGFRMVRKAAGVTLNDVLMMVVSMSLQRYLDARGQLPAGSLSAGVMVSTEPPDAPPRQSGNRFGNFVTTLATDVEDPWARLQSISSVAAEARVRLEVIGLDIPVRWLDIIPPAMAIAINRRGLAQQRKHPEVVRCSLIVSNMRGSDGQRLLGSKIDGMFICGPVSDGGGLFVSAYSSGDRLDFTVLANPSALDAPDELAAGFHAALAELVALASERASRV